MVNVVIVVLFVCLCVIVLAWWVLLYQCTVSVIYGQREVSSDFVLQTSDFVLQTSDFVLQTLYLKVGMDIVTHFRFQFYNNKMDNISM